MEVPKYLLDNFAKITNNKDDNKNQNNFVYGTVVEFNGDLYVKLDGSNVTTPANTTVSMKDGERVKGEIVDHVFTVTGNLTDPSASTQTTNDIIETTNSITENVNVTINTLKDLTEDFNEFNEFVSDTSDKINTLDEGVQLLKDKLTSLIVDVNGESKSLMEQTPEGWTLAIDTLMSDVNSQGENIKDLLSVINITTKDGAPYIELGASESDFRLALTNKEIDFKDGSTLAAYISNNSLYIKTAVIDDELKIGGFSWMEHGNGTNKNVGLVWRGE